MSDKGIGSPSSYIGRDDTETEILCLEGLKKAARAYMKLVESDEPEVPKVFRKRLERAKEDLATMALMWAQIETEEEKGK